MAATTKNDAMRAISRQDLMPYAKKAIKAGTLPADEAEQARKDYQQFMLLVWINTIMNFKEFVVPTERADAIWHEHILDTAQYRAFCDELTGRYIDHNPGLEKGSQRFNEAMSHTRSVQDKYGRDGYHPTYMAGCGGAVAPASAGKSAPAVGHSDGASCGASCGAGCGAGCGGG